jgi:hypothetical protein
MKKMVDKFRMPASIKCQSLYQLQHISSLNTVFSTALCEALQEAFSSCEEEAMA